MKVNLCEHRQKTDDSRKVTERSVEGWSWTRLLGRIGPVVLAMVVGLLLCVPVVALMTYSGFSGPTQISGTEYQWTMDVTTMTPPDKEICLTYGVEGGTPTTVGCTDPGTTPGTWVCTATLPANSTVYWDMSSWSGACGDKKTDGVTGTVSTTPTGIALVSFSATPSGAAIVLDWETAGEIGTLGFMLYRAEPHGGVWQPLNDKLIPSEMSGSPLGSVYQFVDNAVQAGTVYDYKLESVDLTGTLTQQALYASATLPAASIESHRIFLPWVER